jgi:hypothetical protein
VFLYLLASTRSAPLGLIPSGSIIVSIEFPCLESFLNSADTQTWLPWVLFLQSLPRQVAFWFPAQK